MRDPSSCQHFTASGDGQTAAGGAVLPGPCSRAGITFADAADIARGGDGGNPQSDDEWGQISDGESARLTQWAEANDLWVDAGIPGALLYQPTGGGRPLGGAEHFVHDFGDDHTEGGIRLWKITKSGRFGFTPSSDGAGLKPRDWFRLRGASPFEYLRRLELLNFVAPDTETRLEGFALTDGNLHVVSSQRYFKIMGDGPTPDVVRDYFEKLGFTALLATGGPDSQATAWYHAGDNLAVFDTWLDNFVLYDGRLYPVDVIPIEPGPLMAELIRRALELPLDSR
jgi:hypothetical protein